jgi:hypothetical protein
MQAPRFGHWIKRGQNLRAIAIPHHGQGQIQCLTPPPQRAFRAQARKPKREDAPICHIVPFSFHYGAGDPRVQPHKAVKSGLCRKVVAFVIKVRAYTFASFFTQGDYQ